MASSEHKVLIITASDNNLICSDFLISDGQYIAGDRGDRYQILQCESTLLALDICQQESPKCILLDWELPDLNIDLNIGLNTYVNAEKFLQKLAIYQIPVVFLIREDLVREENEQIVNLETHDYLIKETLTKELLCATLRHAIAIAKLHQKLADSTDAVAQTKIILQEAQEIATFGIWELDVHTGAVKWSQEIFSILGLVPDQSALIYNQISQYFNPDDWAKLDRLIARAVQQGLAYEAELRFTRANGISGCILSKGKPKFDTQGKVNQLFGVAIDISDRKLAESQFQEQIKRKSLLREITQKIRLSLDLDTIFETATLEIRQFLKSDRVGIFKFDPDSNFNDGEFVAESVAAGFDSVVKVPFHDDCFGEQYAEAYRYGKYQAVDDIYDSKLLECHINILKIFQIRANLVMPLLNGEALWGLLCIHQCSAPRHWEPTEIDLIQQISYQLAIAIQQACLYQQVQTELIDKQKLYLRLSTELNQKKILIKEVHHRVKNNLQLMSSLLRMQFRKTTPELKILLEDYQNRIQSMALIHVQLYRNDDQANINFYDYISDLITNLFHCYGSDRTLIRCQLAVSSIFLPIDQSIPVGLIINELVSNTLKYAFPQGMGKIDIQLTQTKNEYQLIVSDNGIGILPAIDLRNTDSLGMQLVYSLTEQLEGKLIYDNHNGTKFQLTFCAL